MAYNNQPANDHYNFTLGYRARQTVYKWWCVVYRPVYKLCHHGNWPAEKEPFYQANQAAAISAEEQQQRDLLASQISQSVMDKKQASVDNILDTIEQTSTPVENNVAPAAVVSQPESPAEPEIDLSNVDDNVLDKANEIMARLAREAAEDEAKKQKEIDEAKRLADEQAKLASIMDKNKVDISLFIEEGKKGQNQN